MIVTPPPYDPSAPVVVVDIGNSTVSMATWFKDDLQSPLSFLLGDQGQFDEALAAHVAACPKGRAAAVVLASVVPKELDRYRSRVGSALDQDALVVGEKIPLPLDVSVDDQQQIGVDRVCAAAAAYEKLDNGCIVVDFGTAVTVDLISDEGTLLGGAILPGLKMQFQSLHEHTACLPLVPQEFPTHPFGRNTVEAIQNGVCRGLAGAVRGLIESIATSLNHWPHVVATGGDLAFMAKHCDFVDTAVTDLTLRGIGLAYTKHMTALGA